MERKNESYFKLWAKIFSIFGIASIVMGVIGGISCMLIQLGDFGFAIGCGCIIAGIISGIIPILMANALWNIGENITEINKIKKEQRAIIQALADNGIKIDNSKAPSFSFSSGSTQRTTTSASSSVIGKSWYCKCGAINPGNATECQSCFAQKSE